ncbi:MAG: peptidoglycan-binding protein [Candidatus Rokuibacteriota bacterium]
MKSRADLRPGAAGEPVRELQRRLSALGFDPAGDSPGVFGAGTEAAVRAFQTARGLLVDGTCGRETWGTIVESGWALGDRLLYLRRPVQRGDDVAELQRRLNALGFDAGREDGLLGPETAAALRAFQRNVGLADDGICGRTTVAALSRLGAVAGEEGSVAQLREREDLRHGPHGIAARRIYIAAAPGFEALGDRVTRGLLGVGASALLDPAGRPESEIAATANRYDAALLVALGAGDRPGVRCAYFESGRFRSESGYRVATAITDGLRTVLPRTETPVGRTYSLLRETRMAAVSCELAGPDDVAGFGEVVSHAGAVAGTIVRGVRAVFDSPPPA